MSDEIYEYLLYDGVEHVSPASFSKEAAEHVITVSGFSKTFSMTGWRLGTLDGAAGRCQGGRKHPEPDQLQRDHLCTIWCTRCNGELGSSDGCGERNAYGF